MIPDLSALLANVRLGQAPAQAGAGPAATIEAALTAAGLMPHGAGTTQPKPRATRPAPGFRRPAQARGAPAPLPGTRFEAGRFSNGAGARPYRLFLPSQPPRGLVVMLHGCTQSPEDFAIGTGMNARAEARGLAVLYPGQERGANGQSCWNWFSPADQGREAGEPAILAGMTRQVAAAHGIEGGHVFVAGLSAGGAMAVILGRTHPELFAAIGVHSGLPYGSARDVASAFAAMSQGGGAGVPEAKRTIVFHGGADHTVNPVNADRIAAEAAGPSSAGIEDDLVRGGRKVHRRTTRDAAGRVLVEDWRIAGLGHAWSGGQPGGSYTDPAGPDASAEMLAFFLDGATA